MNDQRRVVVKAAAQGIALVQTLRFSGSAMADQPTAVLYETLRRGGLAILIRHASAPGTFDPPGFKLDDCSTQRNLDEAGRAHATKLGQALRSEKIPIDAVFSSQWCRCLETARLAFPERAIQPQSFLNSPTGLAPEQREARLNEWRGHLAQFQLNKSNKSNRIYVSHMFNVQDLTGQSILEANALIVKIKPDTSKFSLEVLGRLQF